MSKDKKPDDWKLTLNCNKKTKHSWKQENEDKSTQVYDTLRHSRMTQTGAYCEVHNANDHPRCMTERDASIMLY